MSTPSSLVQGIFDHYNVRIGQNFELSQTGQNFLAEKFSEHGQDIIEEFILFCFTNVQIFNCMRSNQLCDLTINAPLLTFGWTCYIEHNKSCTSSEHFSLYILKIL